MESTLLYSFKDEDGDQVVITPRCDRKSSMFLTRYEVARIVGIRATEIASGQVYTADPAELLGQGAASLYEQMDDGASNGTSTVGVSPVQRPRTKRRLDADSEAHVIFDVAERAKNPLSLAVDPVMIAKQELVAKKIRMIVQRKWPRGYKENIPVSDLAVDESWLDLRY